MLIYLVLIIIRFGDIDLDLSLANPLHLCSVLKDKRFANSELVLLHASYPFYKEASYLASVYQQVMNVNYVGEQIRFLMLIKWGALLQVYVDFGLAVPKLSVKGMQSAVSGLLELSPLSKV